VNGFHFKIVSILAGFFSLTCHPIYRKKIEIQTTIGKKNKPEKNNNNKKKERVQFSETAPLFLSVLFVAVPGIRNCLKKKPKIQFSGK
jgi:hypothetical protein